MPNEKYVTPLEKARRACGLSQKELERRSGVQQKTISLAELGNPIYRVPAAALVQFFGFPLHEMHLLYPERYVDTPFEFKYPLSQAS